MPKAPHIYLLLGPEEGEKASFLDHIRKLIGKESGEQPDEHVFYSSDTKISDVLPLLRTGSLFGGHTLVLFHGAHEVRGKEETALLKEYVAHPPDNGTLVMITAEHRVEAAWPKEIPEDQRKIFWEMFDNQKKGWVIGYCRKRGVTMESDAAELLLELVENNTLALGQEIDRLVGFVGRGGTLTVEEIETYLFHSREESVFSLFDALSEGDLEYALDILGTLQLSSQNHPVQILAGLMWQFRRLRDLKAIVNERVELTDAFRRINIRGKRMQRTYERALGRYSLHELERILALGTDYDEMFRSGLQGISDGLLRQFLYYAIVRKGARAEVGGVATD